MANTRKSAKRARQADKRQTVNRTYITRARTAYKRAAEAIKKKESVLAKSAYLNAVRTLDMAAIRGFIHRAQASRKIGRLTHLAKKTLPEILPFKLG